MASKEFIVANWQLSDIISFEESMHQHYHISKQFDACRKLWFFSVLKDVGLGSFCVQLRLDDTSKPIFVKTHLYQELKKSETTKVCYTGKEERYLFQPNDLSAAFIFKRPDFLGTQIKCDIYFYESKESAAIASSINDECVGKPVCAKPHHEAVEVATVLQQSSEKLSGDLSSLFQKELFADVTLRCGSESFQVHKAILCARSEVFGAMFQSPMKETTQDVVYIKEEQPDVFRAVLEYIYSGRNKDMTDWNTACGILGAADFYSLPGLKKACSAYLKSAVSEGNALTILAVADLYDGDLRQDILRFVSDNYDVLKMSEKWKSLQKEKPLLVMAIMNEKIEDFKSLISDTKSTDGKPVYAEKERLDKENCDIHGIKLKRRIFSRRKK